MALPPLSPTIAIGHRWVLALGVGYAGVIVAHVVITGPVLEPAGTVQWTNGADVNLSDHTYP
jgi:hypothetical protein